MTDLWGRVVYFTRREAVRSDEWSREPECWLPSVPGMPRISAFTVSMETISINLQPLWSLYRSLFHFLISTFLRLPRFNNEFIRTAGLKTVLSTTRVSNVARNPLENFPCCYFIASYKQNVLPLGGPLKCSKYSSYILHHNVFSPIEWEMFVSFGSTPWVGYYPKLYL